MIWLQDRQHRKVKYLRLSVTDRCNLRCTYCMPEAMTFRDRAELMTFEELTTAVELFVELGVSKVRITGGEPLARRGIVDLVRRVAAVPGIDDLSMTTNGVLLEGMAADLHAAGLQRLNVSLDTIDPARFREMTRWGDIKPVISGIRAAREVGFSPIKINAVLIRGMNDGEAGDLIRFCRDEGLVLRFIEYMPIGVDSWWTPERFLKIDEMTAVVKSQGFRIEPSETATIGGGPAEYWRVTAPEGGPSAEVGFIAALSHNFCAACNRVRLTSDGRVRECLTSGGRLSLRDMFRAGTPREEILAAVKDALYGKVDGHGFAPDADGGLHTFVSMSSLGG